MVPDISRKHVNLIVTASCQAISILGHPDAGNPNSHPVYKKTADVCLLVLGFLGLGTGRRQISEEIWQVLDPAHWPAAVWASRGAPLWVNDTMKLETGVVQIDRLHKGGFMKNWNDVFFFAAMALLARYLNIKSDFQLFRLWNIGSLIEMDGLVGFVGVNADYSF